MKSLARLAVVINLLSNLTYATNPFINNDLKPYQRHLPRNNLPIHSQDTRALTALQNPQIQVPRSDPWTYIGPKGLYRLSNYHAPSIKVSWFATFIITCVNDILDAVAHQGFKPNNPYPGGIYACDLDYSFPSGYVVRFHLKLEKLQAQGWEMTFADVAEDLEALYYAALWFEDRPGGMPAMDVEVSRVRSGNMGPSFKAEKGMVGFSVAVDGNGTVVKMRRDLASAHGH